MENKKKVEKTEEKEEDEKEDKKRKRKEKVWEMQVKTGMKYEGASGQERGLRREGNSLF